MKDALVVRDMVCIRVAGVSSQLVNITTDRRLHTSLHLLCLTKAYGYFVMRDDLILKTAQSLCPVFPTSTAHVLADPTRGMDEMIRRCYLDFVW